jgi:hypothetical protein
VGSLCIVYQSFSVENNQVLLQKLPHLQYDFKQETAQKTAELLLQINAIKLQPQNHLHGLLDGSPNIFLTIPLISIY